VNQLAQQSAAAFQHHEFFAFRFGEGAAALQCVQVPGLGQVDEHHAVALRGFHASVKRFEDVSAVLLAVARDILFQCGVQPGCAAQRRFAGVRSVALHVAQCAEWGAGCIRKVLAELLARAEEQRATIVCPWDDQSRAARREIQRGVAAQAIP